MLSLPVLGPVRKVGHQLRGCLRSERIPVRVRIGDALGRLGQLDLIEVKDHLLPRAELIFAAVDRDAKVLDLAPIDLGRDFTALLRVPIGAVVRECFEWDAAAQPSPFLHDGVAIAAQLGLRFDAVALVVHQTDHELLRGRSRLDPEGQAARLAIRPQIEELATERNVHARVVVVEEGAEHRRIARRSAGHDLVAGLAAIAVGIATARARDVIVEERREHVVLQCEFGLRGRVRLRRARSNCTARARAFSRWLSGLTRATPSHSERRQRHRAHPK